MKRCLLSENFVFNMSGIQQVLAGAIALHDKQLLAKSLEKSGIY
jgi:hypothetical protein